MEYIGHIYYINLDSRKDRLLSINTQLKLFNLVGERISATNNKNFPQKGCTMSHIRCLENAIKHNYKNILILEDDFICNLSTNEFVDKLQIFFEKFKNNWDVLMLSGTHSKSNNIEDNSYISKVIEAQSTVSYIVNNKYYYTLLKNYLESYNNINKNNPTSYCIDINWKKLQKKDNWYIFNPVIAYQDASYSSIEKKFTNYFNQKYILCKLKGRLGNQLFQIANSYYLSKKYGKKLIIMGDKNGLDKIYHDIERNLIKNNFEIENIVEEELKYNKINLDRNKNTVIDGYFQSELYFYPIKDIIKELFYLNINDLEKLKALRSKYKIDNKSISIHVRKGDYVNNKVYTNIPLDYYEKCITYFGVNNKYIIFSDNIEWCKTQNIFIDLPFKLFVEEKNIDYIELYLMASCKNNIITNSTFSWWAAYLNNNPDKIIIAPNRWFNSDKKEYNTVNLIPPDWKIMNITDITIVTAYFKLKTSKHSNQDYFKWLQNTLNMNYPFVIFILRDDIETKQYILKIRKNKLSITLIIELSFEDFYVFKYNWEKQHLIDTEEKHIHNKYLYMIWNEKPELLYKIAINNPFNSKIFFWLDIGYIRDIRHEFYYSNFNVDKIPKDKLLFGMIDNYNTLGGGMFCGYLPIIKWFRNTYYNYLDKCISNNKFCGKEQTLFNEILLNYANNFKIIHTKEDWFYLFWYLNINDTKENFFNSNNSIKCSNSIAFRLYKYLPHIIILISLILILLLLRKFILIR